MLHDTNKRLIKVSDIYPDYADLKKGDYVIRLQLRHDDAVLLDKMKDTPVVVERKLKDAITVPVYATNREAVKGGKAVKERALHPGMTAAITQHVRNADTALQAASLTCPDLALCLFGFLWRLCWPVQRAHAAKPREPGRASSEFLDQISDFRCSGLPHAQIAVIYIEHCYALHAVI